MEKLDDKNKKKIVEEMKAGILKDVEDGAERMEKAEGEFGDLKNVDFRAFGDRDRSKSLLSKAVAAQDRSGDGDKFGGLKNVDLELLRNKANGLSGTGEDRALLSKAMAAQGKSGKGNGSSSKGSRLSAGRQKMAEKAQKIKSQAMRKVKEQERVKKIRKIAQNKQNQIKRTKEQVKKQKENTLKKMKAQKKAMFAKAKELKKRAATAKKSHVSSGAVKLLTVITLTLAILVDIIDLIGTLGVELAAIPTIIAFIINLCSSLIITVTWILIFSGSKGKDKKMAKVVIRSILMLFGLENVPLVELLPFNAAAVILNYLDFRKGNKAKKS